MQGDHPMRFPQKKTFRVRRTLTPDQRRAVQHQLPAQRRQTNTTRKGK